MPLHKFKSFESARQAQWTFRPDAAYYDRLAKLFDLAAALNPTKFPQGIFKYRSFAEAQQHRQEVELANALKKKNPPA
jgi:hypothetical protein